ncbi:MAG: hypothetical protein A2261_03265 [Candidatus Magasanikbacteria bacterium RIFOXYA2_FULL_44_8]|uniref:SMC hinge domain-containing protein n=1 Tax=Candidatus Magasanikbacteria bacterium RIFOXYA2_FULL_44_8 TaxID=1798696 RepID=A0A1F6NJK5_9BACT|nr:MAG: hypothetical protein A2261_03265 [Candidatus Magasanikbacteria bacterium RIFOXYA2_FULL_44_8]
MQTQYQEAGKGNVGWIENKLKELKNKRDEIVAALKLAEAEVEKAQARVLDKKKIIENLTVEKTEKTVQISRLQSAFLQNQSEQNYFQFVGLSAVKAVLDAKNKFGGKVHGIVAELAEVDEDYRLAMDTAAASSLASVVVEDDETGRHAIEYLRYNKLGVATFLPLNKIRGRFVSDELRSVLGEQGVIGLAIELLKFNPRFEPIFSHILGDTLIVRDLAVAQRLGIGRFRMVTLEGDIVERHGVMKGGWRGKDRNLSFATKISLTTEEKLREYQLQIGTEQQKLIDLENTLEKHKGELMNLEVESQTVQHRCGLHIDERQNLDKEIAGLDRELSLLQITPEQYGALMVQFSKEKTMMVKQLASAQRRVEEIGAEIEDFNRKEEEKKQRVFNLQAQMQVKQNEVNNILNNRNDLKIQAAKLETKQEDLLTEAQNEMSEPLVGVVDRNPVVVKLEDLPTVADSVQKLKYQLSLIGGIDEDVTAEYTTTKERYDFLSGQIDDLAAATFDLETMIEELDGIMKTKRAVAFKKIRKEFDRYFKILFGGGTADLTELYGEPEEEVVEGMPNAEGQMPVNEKIAEGEEMSKKKKSEKVLYGIDIAANPPGKKIKHLNALSGGERTLTSIALICAILNNNPSPFVVLDEVEAALDEANTQRFVKIMGELSTHSQFIVITHNRVTMHAADALYGVTMSGDGISKLLSVKLEEVKNEK